jgi:enoyl-CoA hydratase
MSIEEALKNESRGGLGPLQDESRSGARRFAEGKGRGGDFENI